MKFRLLAMLAMGLLAASDASAHQTTYKTRHCQCICDYIIDAVKYNNLDHFKQYVSLQKITDFTRITDSKYEMNPLHWAAALGHLDIIRYLILQEANVNALTPQGFTALHLAILSGNTAAARCLLLESGANANIATPGGITALYLAQKTNNKDIEQLLMRMPSRIKRRALKLNKIV